MPNISEKLSRLIDDTPFMIGEGEKGRLMVSFPTVNVKESDLYYDFELAVPGFKREDISIKVKGDKLIVKGKREVDVEPEDEDSLGYIRNEHRVESFERIYELDALADNENIEAELKDGILKFRIFRR